MADFPSPGLSIAHPIAELPPEILLVILDLTMNPGEYQVDRIFKMVTYRHVCQYWRSLLLDAAHMWSLIDLRYSTLGQVFCGRSKACPVRISYVENDLTASSVGVSSATACQWLTPHAHRIEGICLVASQTAMRAVLSHIQGASPQLRQLTNVILPQTRDRPVIALNIRAREVHRMSFNGLYATDWAQVPDSLASLTSLVLTRLGTLAYIPIPRLLSILLRCTGLQTLVLLSALSPRAPVPDDTPVAELPALRSLELSHSYTLPVAEFLEHVSIPSTASITFHAHGVTDLSTLLPKKSARVRFFASSHNGDDPQSLRISGSSLTMTKTWPDCCYRYK